MPTLLIADSNPRFEHQLQGPLIPSPTQEQPHRQQTPFVSAQSQHIQQLSLETSSKSMTYHQIKLGYACEPYIQQANSVYTAATSGKS